MELTNERERWAPLAKRILDRIEDPEDHAHPYNLIIEGLWECAAESEAITAALEADLTTERAARKGAEAKVEKLTRCLVELSLSSAFTEWQEDSPETWAAFDKAMHDGSDGDEIDLDVVCKALGIKEEK